MKLIALTPIQHDNRYYAKDEVLEVGDNEQVTRLVDQGVARVAPDTFPTSEGQEVVRQAVEEEDKLEPTAEQIAEAEKAANEPELKPEEQFSKGAIAQSVVAQGDVSKIKETSDTEPRRK